MIDKLLEKYNLTYDDLNAVEKETLKGWMKSLSTNKITIPTIKKHIATMRDSVEKDLAVSGLGSKKDLFLKARLRNYMLLEAYLTTPERAKEALESAVSGLAGKRT